MARQGHVSSPEIVGCIANAAIRRGGAARIVATLGASTYVSLGGTLIWLGEAGAMRHPRAVLGGDRKSVATLSPTARPWRPQLPRLCAEPRALMARLRALHGALGEPRGLGRLLRGEAPEPPFDRALPSLLDFAAACRRNDPEAAMLAALPLLGLGPGLTPSGDDFVGAALFARLALVRGGRAAGAWLPVARRLVGRSGGRTTRVSAALFADLAAGRSFAALHDLVSALDSGDGSGASQSARLLIEIGHSSGWDMLTGLTVGIAGRLTLRQRGRT
jgi:hypothetical protein